MTDCRVAFSFKNFKNVLLKIFRHTNSIIGNGDDHIAPVIFFTRFLYNITGYRTSCICILYSIAYNIETNDGLLPLSYQVQDDTLNIVEKQGHESYSYIHIDINFLQEMLGQSHVIENSNKVTIYIPKKNDLSSFFCKMGYGDLDIESLGVKKAVISCSDGDVKIKDSALNSLEMETELGDLHLKNTSVKNSQIRMDDGDVKAENTVFQGKNKITSTLGNIKLGIPKEVAEDLSIEAEASDIDIPEKLGKVMTDEDGEQVLITENKPQDSLELKSEDGDIKIIAEK